MGLPLLILRHALYSLFNPLIVEFTQLGALITNDDFLVCSADHARKGFCHSEEVERHPQQLCHSN